MAPSVTNKTTELMKQFRLLVKHFPGEIGALLITLLICVFMMKIAIENNESGFSIPLFWLGAGAFCLSFFNMLWFVKKSFDKRSKGEVESGE